MASGSNTNTISECTLKDTRWYFTTEQLQNTPSRRCGIDADQELDLRQHTAYLIQDLGQRARVSQLCINTAIVYMHRFYMFHSFTHFHRNGIATASLFLAAKVEEQPRKLEHIIDMARKCLAIEMADTKEALQEQSQDLVFNENVLLQTLGFDVAIDHPHTHVVKTCHLVKACKDLAQTSYFLASNSLHLTYMCLQYKPTVVACFCIYLACKWSRWEIPQSTEGKYWFHYVDKNVTCDLLEQLTDEFIAIYEKSPAKLRNKLNTIKDMALKARVNDPQRPDASAIPGPSGTPRGVPQSGSSSGEHSRPSTHSSHHRERPHGTASGSHHSSHSKHIPNVHGEHSKQPSIPHNKVPHGGQMTSAQRPRTDRPQMPPDYRSAGQPAVLAPKAMASLSRAATANAGKNAGQLQQELSYLTPQQIQPQQSSQPQQQQQQQQQQQHQQQPQMPRDPNVLSKQRQIPSATGSSGHNMQRHVIQKQDQRHMVDPKLIDAGKNLQMKQAYPPINDMQRHQQMSGRPPPYPQNYPQAMRNSQQPPISHHSSMHSMQTIDQSVHIQQIPTAIATKSLTESSSFRLTDDLRPNDVMDICSPPRTTANHSQPLKAPSIFSPERLDKPCSIPKMTSSPPERQSRQRPETPQNTSRKRLAMEPPSTPTGQKIVVDKKMNSARRLTDTPAMPTYQIPPPVSPFDGPPLSQQITSHMPPKHMVANIAHKRALDEQIRQEDGVDFREQKIRKVDIVPLSPTSAIGYDTADKPSKAYLSTLNGIETNPALVSSLLKESLFTDSKFGSIQIKEETVTSDSIVQQNVIQAQNTIVPIDSKQGIPGMVGMDVGIVPSVSLPSTVDISAMSSAIIGEPIRSKSEKKKKKEKHKHKDKEKDKEKDKSKDREEKKKHKKDKERLKERGLETEPIDPIDTHNPIRITIPKDRINLQPMPIIEQTAFKIKIPKDRIKSDGAPSVQRTDLIGVGPPIIPSPSLKIKIPKPKDFNVDQSFGDVGNNTGGHHHKKKERDREKVKSGGGGKSSTMIPATTQSDFGKHNGGTTTAGNGSTSNGAGGGGSGRSSTSKMIAPPYPPPPINNHYPNSINQGGYPPQPYYTQPPFGNYPTKQPFNPTIKPGNYGQQLVNNSSSSHYYYQQNNNGGNNGYPAKK